MPPRRTNFVLQGDTVTSLITQPAADTASKKNFDFSMRDLIDFNARKALIPSADFDILETIFPSRSAHFWGIRKGRNNGNVNKFSKVNPGDITIFAKDMRIFAVATVAHTFRSANFAHNLWAPDDEGNDWELVCAFDEVRRVDIPVLNFNQLVGYKDNNSIQGFNVLPEDKCRVFLNSYDLYSQRHLPQSDEEPLDPPLDASWPELDAAVTAKRRREQGALRGALLGRRTEGTCALCGESYPAEFLIAAHIKKRQYADDDERRDIPNIAMLACKFGCDELFERGYISVDENATVITSQLPPELQNSAIASRLKDLAGRTLPIDFVQPRGVYFDWHFHKTFLPELN